MHPEMNRSFAIVVLAAEEGLGHCAVIPADYVAQKERGDSEPLFAEREMKDVIVELV